MSNMGMGVKPQPSGGGLCPLIDADGKPIVTDRYTLEHDTKRK